MVEATRARAAAPDFDLLDERELIEAAKQSREAFAVLYRRYVPTVYGYLYRRIGSHEIAEDLTAATFEKALRALPAFEWRGVPVSAWLIRIASRKLTDHFRTEARRATVPADPLEPPTTQVEFFLQPADQTDLATIVGEAEEVALVLEALDDIPERYRAAIVLKFISELTSEEAADALGCSRPTFAVLLHRSVKALQKAVERRGCVK